jgi:hypothetical protein
MNYKTPLSLWLILLVSFHTTHLFADMLKGNPDTKVCHMETCKYANSKGCTMAFENGDEAEKMGYRMCTKCTKKMMGSDEMAENGMPMHHKMMGKRMMMGCMDEMMHCMDQMQPAEMMP